MHRRLLAALAAVAATLVAVGIANGGGGPQTVTQTYVVPGTSAPLDFVSVLGPDNPTGGIDTGFALKAGLPVVVTASGSVCGITNCALPNATVSPDGLAIPATSVWLAPGLRSVSLIAQVGDGPFQFVGSGPTTLTGSGELVFYVNDAYYADNSGSFTANVSYQCWPGNGYGDANHYRCGPPGQQ